MKKQLHHQKGFALITAISFTVLITLLAITASNYAQKSNSKNFRVLTHDTQLLNIAKSGLQEGVSWFNRQTSQPVKYESSDAEQNCADQAFFPKENTSIPEKGDTLDESIGLVKEYRLDQNLYGRFILKRQDCDNPTPHAVRDITLERGKNSLSNLDDGQGISWYLESEAILYEKNDPNAEPDESPNRILGKRIVGTEISRLKLSPPSKSAVTVFGTATSTFNTNCEVAGDTHVSYGIYMDDDAGNVTTNASYSLNNPSATNKFREVGLQVDPQEIFGVNLTEMRTLANNIYYAPSELPNQLPMGIHYLSGGTFTFNAAKNLFGQGILIVDGNLILDESSASMFDGLVYVTGTLTIRESNSLSGAVIASRVVCTPTNAAFIEYNDFILEQVRTRLSGYRMNNLTFNVIN